MTNVKTLQPIVFLSNIWEDYKRKQDDIKRRKLIFLYREAYKNFYSQCYIQHQIRIIKSGKVDLPAFEYAKRDARAAAIEVVMTVAKNNRINQCYTARINEYKKMGLI